MHIVNDIRGGTEAVCAMEVKMENSVSIVDTVENSTFPD